MSAKATIYLIDASPYVFRAFFSMPASITDPSGRPVNAVHGFTSFLFGLLEGERPQHVALAFDESLTTSFRNDIYQGYKASRPQPPPDLVAQLEGCRAVAESLGIACFASERYEADDIIATFVGRHVPAGHAAVVVTSDKDLAQLVEARVTLWDFARDARLGPGEVFAKLGVRPDQVVDLLALAGDPVDDIPGVRGVGRKTAAALLMHFGTLDALLARLAEVEGLPVRGAAALRKKLEAGREMALLSRRLSVAAFDAPIPHDLEALRWRGPVPDSVEHVFSRLGFGARLKERAGRLK